MCLNQDWPRWEEFSFFGADIEYYLAVCICINEIYLFYKLSSGLKISSLKLNNLVLTLRMVAIQTHLIRKYSALLRFFKLKIAFSFSTGRTNASARLLSGTRNLGFRKSILNLRGFSACLNNINVGEFRIVGGTMPVFFTSRK